MKRKSENTRGTGSFKKPFVITTGKGAAGRRKSSALALGAESKFIDYYITDATVVTTTASSEQDPATVNCLNATAVGDGESNRDGRKVMLQSVYIKGQVYGNPLPDEGDTPTSASVRLLLVLDKQTNGVQFSAEDVLLNTSGSDVLSMRNLQYTSRFKVLKDITYDLPVVTSTDGSGTNSGTAAGQSFSIFEKLNVPCTFTDTTALISSIMDNSLHVMAIVSAGSSVKLSYQSRVRFVG